MAIPKGTSFQITIPDLKDAIRQEIADIPTTSLHALGSRAKL